MCAHHANVHNAYCTLCILWFMKSSPTTLLTHRIKGKVKFIFFYYIHYLLVELSIQQHLSSLNEPVYVRMQLFLCVYSSVIITYNGEKKRSTTTIIIAQIYILGTQRRFTSSQTQRSLVRRALFLLGFCCAFMIAFYFICRCFILNRQFFAFTVFHCHILFFIIKKNCRVYM